jgi:hypothetical protein
MEMVNQTLAQQVIPHQSMVDEPVISTMQNRIQSWSMRVTWEWVMIQFIDFYRTEVLETTMDWVFLSIGYH